MALNIDRAYPEKLFRKLNPEAFCDSFWLASQQKTEALGAAFARALSHRTPDEILEQPTIRIGLAGAGDVGKSTFVKGFFGALQDTLTLETSTQLSKVSTLAEVSFPFLAFSEKELSQSLVLSSEAGAVLHRDAMWNKMYQPSRLSNFDDVHRYGAVNIELIEHPYADKNKAFDCILMVEKRRDWSLAALFDKHRKFGGAEREMSVFATDEWRDNDRFKSFLQQMKPYSTAAFSR